MMRILLTLLLIMSFSSCGIQAEQKVLIAGHRGNPAKYPENTLPSFESAINLGADAIEFDIQMSKDGVPVIIHDRTVDRTTNGRGEVESLTFEQLAALDAGSAHRPRVDGCRIPTLEQVLQLAKDNHMLIFPEIKGYRSPEDIKIMIKQIIDAGFEHHAVVQSFNYDDFKVVRSMSKNIKLAYLAGTHDEVDRALKESESDKLTQLFASEWLLYDSGIIDAAHQAHVPVIAWTVDRESDFDILQRFGVDGIITNELEAMKRN